MQRRLYVLAFFILGVLFMATGLIELLVYLIVGGLIIYVVFWIVGMLALPQPIKNVITIIVALIVLLWLLSTLGVLPGVF